MPNRVEIVKNLQMHSPPVFHISSSVSSSLSLSIDVRLNFCLLEWRTKLDETKNKADFSRGNLPCSILTLYVEPSILFALCVCHLFCDIRSLNLFHCIFELCFLDFQLMFDNQIVVAFRIGQLDRDNKRFK